MATSGLQGETFTEVRTESSDPTEPPLSLFETFTKVVAEDPDDFRAMTDTESRAGPDPADPNLLRMVVFLLDDRSRVSSPSESPRIVAVTYRDDLSADLVVLAAERRGIDLYRFNTEDYPVRTRLTLDLLRPADARLVDDDREVELGVPAASGFVARDGPSQIRAWAQVIECSRNRKRWPPSAGLGAC